MEQITHLSLFSGIGGLDIAAEWAGFCTAGQCEWADYPTKVLEKHWPDVPRWRDIRTLTKESFYERTGLRTVDIVSGGFPCQPFSVAGKRNGKNDDRYLWPEMLRVIVELRPRWVVGENVAGIVNLALEDVLSNLEAEGYESRAIIIPACAVDAPHRRDRVAIVAYDESQRKRRLPVQSRQSRQAGADTIRGSEIVADSDKQGVQGRQKSGNAESKRTATVKHIVRCSKCDDVPNTNHGSGSVRRDRELPEAESNGSPQSDLAGRTQKHGIREWWPAEPGVGRVAYGVPRRVDRLKCLGNAVVPQQFYPIFYYIRLIEGGSTT